MTNFNLYLRMFLYVGVTTIITFVSLLDALQSHNFSDVSNLDWLKICLKSLLPGLVSLKAFLDTTINTNGKKIEIDVLQG